MVSLRRVSALPFADNIFPGLINSFASGSSLVRQFLKTFRLSNRILLFGVYVSAPPADMNVADMIVGTHVQLPGKLQHPLALLQPPDCL